MPTDVPTRISYTCAGGETAFPYPFRIFEAVDLQVFRNENLLSLGFDYTITNPDGTGNVVPIFVPLAGDIVLLNLNIPIVRTVDYQNGNALNAQTLDDEADKIFAILNQIDTQQDSLCPHYATNSSPNDPNDLILPILPTGSFWSKGPGGGIVATSLTPDPAASALQAALASSNPTQGAALVNTLQNVTVQEVLHRNNSVFDTASRTVAQTDYGRTFLLIDDGLTITLPLISSLTASMGFWIKVYNPAIKTGGFDESIIGTVVPSGSDNIINHGTQKLIGAGKTFTFIPLHANNWIILDDDYTNIGTLQDCYFDRPEGEWVVADGRAISRTMYSELFLRMGTTWGVGDGSTTFNLPDSRGRSSLGTGPGPGLTDRSIGQIGGEEAHALIAAENGPHNHPITPSGLNGLTTGTLSFSGGGAAGDFVPIVVGSSGSGTPHNTMHPFYVVKTMIKIF